MYQLILFQILFQFDDWVKMPSQGEAEKTMRAFHERYGLPSVFGCIDGTQVCIQAPSVDEAAYVNRKHNHAINVQVTLNSQTHILVKLFPACIIENKT